MAVFVSPPLSLGVWYCLAWPPPNERDDASIPASICLIIGVGDRHPISDSEIQYLGVWVSNLFHHA